MMSAAAGWDDVSDYNMRQWSIAGQEDDVPDYDLELKNREVVKIARQVDQKKLTRREVVSNIYKIFDHLGLLAPTTIKFKMLLQKWTKAGLEWNEPLEAS